MASIRRRIRVCLRMKMKNNSILKITAVVLVTLCLIRVISNNLDLRPNNTAAQGSKEKTYEYRKSDYAILGKVSFHAPEQNNGQQESAIISNVAADPKKDLILDLKNLHKDDSDSDSKIFNQEKNIISSKEKTYKLVDSLVTSILNRKKNASDTEKYAENLRQLTELSKKFFSSGFGLEAVKTASGENNNDMWKENGVIYQPIKPDVKYTAPRLTNYEPFVPFNKTLFFMGSSETETAALKSSEIVRKKVILWYQPARYTEVAEEPTPLRFCPDFPCLMTTNRKYFNESSLVVFNGQRVGPKPPERAYPHQLYMFHNQEPPLPIFFKTSKFKLPPWQNVFNWTMTYRTDSTIPSYYGLVRKHPNPPKKDYKQILSKKNGTVAWMVSHCGSPSKRDNYVNELKKYIQVDIYGSCGPLKCERKDDEKCNQNIATKYKFYLGFENGLCRDYISEKFFRFMPLDIVTVSRAARGDLDLHAAPGTYIDTNKYSSPKKLAEYLTYLDKNDDAYIDVLKEKDKYIYLFEDWAIWSPEGLVTYIHYHYEAVPFCQACQKLWNRRESDVDVVDNIGDWFDQKSCLEPDDI